MNWIVYNIILFYNCILIFISFKFIKFKYLLLIILNYLLNNLFLYSNYYTLNNGVGRSESNSNYF